MSLNEQQREASRDRSALVSIAACPGSGKTTTLVEAVKQEIDMTGETAHIVIITFTNAAAVELKHRLNINVGYIGTLHSYCMRIMRGVIPGLTLIDEDEAKKLLASTALQLRYKGSEKALSEAKDGFWKRHSIMGGISDAERVVLAYASKLQREKLLEYDMLLMRTFEYLKKRPETLEPVSIFVDEFQDTSRLDAEIYGLLKQRRMLVVGDCDQSIYRFRGADPEVFIAVDEFASQHRLVKNYRSGSHIVQAANRLIAHSTKRISMVMEAANLRANGYYPPQARLADDVPTMLAFIRQNLVTDPTTSTAILTRTNKEVEQIKADLQAMRIPINETKQDLISDLAIVRTLIGLALNPMSEVLGDIAHQHHFSRLKITSASPCQTLTQTIDFVRRMHSISEQIAELFAMAPEIMADDEPYRLFDLIRNEHKSDVSSTGISVLTMHGSKGLEFDHVILANADSHNQDTNDDDRRLFYVAMTRARHTLIAVGAKNRYLQWKGNVTHDLSPYVYEAGMVIT